jgi:hypothetical protein
VLDIDDYCAIFMHPFDMSLVYNFYWDVPSTKEINLRSENSKSAFPTNFIVESIFTVSESKTTVLESRFTVLRV